MSVGANLQTLATILWDIVEDAPHNVPGVRNTSIGRIAQRKISACKVRIFLPSVRIEDYPDKGLPCSITNARTKAL